MNALYKTQKGLILGLLCISLSGCYRNPNDDTNQTTNSHIGTRENGNVIINGIANFNNRSFENLTVNGVANLKDVVVKHTAVINGVLKATNATFNLISISTTSLYLNNCKVNTIIVRQTDPRKEQILELIDTHVGQSITFEQGNGKVIANKGTIIEGQIIGGVLVDSEIST